MRRLAQAFANLESTMDSLLQEANERKEVDVKLVNEYLANLDTWMRQACFNKKSPLQKIYNNVVKQFDGQNYEDLKGKKRKQFREAILSQALQVPEITRLVNHIAGSAKVTGKVDKSRVNDAWVKLIFPIAVGKLDYAAAQKYAKENATETFNRASLQSLGYEDPLFKFLPAGLQVEVDAGKVLSKWWRRLNEESKDLRKSVMTKAAQISDAVENWNQIVRDVYADIENGNETTKLCATIAAITIETGLRPGRKENKINIKKQDGEVEQVRTFGTSTMLLRQLDLHVRKGFATIEFMGKKGGINVAKIESAKLTKVLWHMVQEMSKHSDIITVPDVDKADRPIFVKKNGKPVSYHTIQRYFEKRFGKIDPTTFRELKATNAVYRGLKQAQKRLLKKILKLKDLAEEEFKKELLNELVAELERVFEKAQEKLSHKSVDTTIGAYIDPRIVMQFLSGRGLGRTLKDVVGRNGKVVVDFDVKDFAERIWGSKKSAFVLRWRKVIGSSSTLNEMILDLRKDVAS